MQVKLEKQYPIQADIESAWKILGNIPELAGCMPGAQITETIDDRHYKGQVKVQVGPASAAFGGTIDVLEFDPARKLIRLQGKGADKGGSSASMDLTATLANGAQPGECLLFGASDVIVNGKFAQFGGRMMTSISDMLLSQFAQNFSAKAAALQQSAAAEAAAGAAGAAPSATVLRGSGAPPSPAALPASELNALAISWQLIKNFVAGLFGKRKPG